MPGPLPTTLPADLFGTASAIQELRALIAEFKEAVAAARKVDLLTKQPDCEDPEKAKLEERVARIEKALDAMAPKPKRKRPRK